MTGRKLLELVVLAIGLAALLSPALAIAAGTVDVCQWPSALRSGFWIMAGAFFAALLLLDLVAGPPAPTLTEITDNFWRAERERRRR